MSHNSSNGCGEVTQGKPNVASCSGKLQQGKLKMAYVHNQWQCCSLSEDRDILVIVAEYLRVIEPV